MRWLRRFPKIEWKRDGVVLRWPYRTVFLSTVQCLFIEVLLVNAYVHLMGGLGFGRWLIYTVVILVLWKLYSAFSRPKPGSPPPPRSRPNAGPSGDPPAGTGVPAVLGGPGSRVAAERKAIPVAD